MLVTKLIDVFIVRPARVECVPAGILEGMII